MYMEFVYDDSVFRRPGLPPLRSDLASQEVHTVVSVRPVYTRVTQFSRYLHASSKLDLATTAPPPHLPYHLHQRVYLHQSSSRLHTYISYQNHHGYIFLLLNIDTETDMYTGLLTIIRKNKAKSKEMRVLFLYVYLLSPDHDLFNVHHDLDELIKTIQ